MENIEDNEDFYAKLRYKSLLELIELFETPPKEEPDYWYFYDEVAYSIQSFGKPGVDYLLAQLVDSSNNEPKLSSLLFALSVEPAQVPDLRSILYSYLNHPQDLVVGWAIRGLAEIADVSLHDVILQFQAHPSPYVRGSVLRYMTRVHPDEAPPLLLAALKDEDYIVRESAIDELDELPYPAALEQIRPLLNDPHPDVREAAQTAVEHLESMV